MAVKVKMRNPIHPALTHFPVALWFTAVIFDICSFGLGNAFTRAAFYVMFVGCIAAIPTALAGLWDFSRLESNHSARPEATVHALLMLVITLFFFVNDWARGQQLGAPHTPAMLFGLACAGLVGISIAGWMGHKLVFHFGANVMVPKGRRVDLRTGARPQMPIRT